MCHIYSLVRLNGKKKSSRDRRPTSFSLLLAPLFGFRVSAEPEVTSGPEVLRPSARLSSLGFCKRTLFTPPKTSIAPTSDVTHRVNTRPDISLHHSDTSTATTLSNNRSRVALIALRQAGWSSIEGAAQCAFARAVPTAAAPRSQAPPPPLRHPPTPTSPPTSHAIARRGHHT